MGQCTEAVWDPGFPTVAVELETWLTTSYLMFLTCKLGYKVYFRVRKAERIHGCVALLKNA